MLQNKIYFLLVEPIILLTQRYKARRFYYLKILINVFFQHF